MKTTIVNKLITFAAAGSISVTAMMANEGLAPAGNMADELEEAIFLQEAKSDLTSAIKKYQEILETDSLVRTVAAEAQYRLAECYWELGNKAQAWLEYEKLKSNYPGEEKWIAAANERLPVEFEATIDPILNGERFLYRYVMPTGVVFGHSETKNYEIEEGGRKLWRRETRRYVGGRGLMTVDFDPVTNKSVRSSTYSEQLGRVECEFSDNGKSAIVEFSNTAEVKEISIPNQAFDNEQVMELIRQFPVEVGYRTELEVLVNFTAMRMPIVCEVIELVEVDTILGLVECYKVQIDIGGTQQYLSITTDERRIPVGMQVGGIEVSLIRHDFYEEGRIREYSNERYGFSINYPDDWTLFENSKKRSNSLERISFLTPGGAAHFEMLCNVNDNYDAIIPSDFEATIQRVAEREQTKWKNYDFGEEPYALETINGLDAAYFRGTRSEDGVAKEEFAAYFILGSDYHYSFVFNGPAKDWRDLEKGYLGIVKSLTE